jgi:phosphinothricin acetyltransferase
MWPSAVVVADQVDSGGAIGCGQNGRMTDTPASASSAPVEVCAAVEDDLPQIVDILNHEAANSDAVFTTQPATVSSRREWFEGFAETGPYRLLVARQGELVLGFASSRRYRDHEAFRETVEVGIGIAARYRGQGIGTLLYRALFDQLADEPVHVALAGIALPNDASVALHRRLGFTEVGMFREYALKNGHYISSLWMQRLSPRNGQDGAESAPEVG